MASRKASIKPFTVDDIPGEDETESRSQVMTLADMNALASVTNDVPEAQDIEDESLGRVLEELRADTSSEASVKVYRVVKDSRKTPFCFSCAPSAFTLDLVAQKYGGGDYLIRIYWRDPDTGVFGVRRAVYQTIEEPRDGVAPGTPAPAAPALAGSNELAELRAELRAIATRNPMDDMKGMLGMMALMREAMGGAPQTAAPVDPLETLERMLGVQSRLKELTGSGDGKKSDTEVFAETATAFIPVLQDALKGVQVIKAPNAEQMVLAAPGDMVTQNAEPQNELQELLARLLKRAVAGKDNFALYADDVLDTIPENELAAFYKMLHEKTWFEQLAMAAPAIRPYRPWFENLYAELMLAEKELFPPEKPPRLTAKPKPGNKSGDAKPADPAKPAG